MGVVLRWLGILFAALVAVVAIGLLVIALATPRLPPINAVAEYQPKMPLRVLTADGVLQGIVSQEVSAMSYSFRVTVRDADGVEASKVLTLTVTE